MRTTVNRSNDRNAFAHLPRLALLSSVGFSSPPSFVTRCRQRKGRSIELDPKYVDVIVKRWQEYTGKEATLAGDRRTFARIAEERIEATV